MSTEIADQIVSSYSLYGETFDFADILHCEETPLRARFYGGVKPHRHQDLHQFFVIVAGGGMAALDGGRYDLTDGLVLNVPPGCVHHFAFDEHSAGLAITIPRDVLDVAELPRETLMALRQPKVLNASISVKSHAQMLQTEYAEQPSAIRSAALRHLAALLALDVARLISPPGRTDGDGIPVDGGRNILQGFTTLVEDHYREHWPVARYANVLGISATHLGRVLRAAIGSTPRATINARLVLEARRQLAYTSRPIQQIADDLGFSDPAYFTRVVQRETGLSPTRLRQRLKGDTTDAAGWQGPDRLIGPRRPPSVGSTGSVSS